MIAPAQCSVRIPKPKGFSEYSDAGAPSGIVRFGRIRKFGLVATNWNRRTKELASSTFSSAQKVSPAFAAVTDQDQGSKSAMCVQCQDAHAEEFSRKNRSASESLRTVTPCTYPEM